MSECSKELESQMNNLVSLFENCIKINNEYKIKHNELIEIFNAYKVLIENCDSPYIKENLYQILNEIDTKFISKDNLNSLLIEQKNMMKEFNEINCHVKELFPDY